MFSKFTSHLNSKKKEKRLIIN